MQGLLFDESTVAYVVLFIGLLTLYWYWCSKRKKYKDSTKKGLEERNSLVEVKKTDVYIGAHLYHIHYM